MPGPEQVADEETLAETTPLLPDTNGSKHNGAPKNNGTLPQEDEGDETSSTPLVDEPTTARLLLVMSSVWVGCFLAALDSTIIATLSAPISASFHSLSLLSWLATAYFIANAALQPLSGRLTDILSRKWGLIFSNVFFTAGNLICGLATSESIMILGRVVAGMGGGGLTAISTFVGSDLVPLRRRGVWQGFGNVCYGVGAGLGGVFGGWINDTIGWRWAFLIQVPLTIISGLLIVFTVNIPVKESSTAAWRRIDFSGSFTLVVTLVLLLLGVNSGGNIVPWTHPLVLISLPLSALFLAVFILIEDRRASEPIIPVRLLLHRTVSSACLTNWFTTMSTFALMFYGPVYFQLQGLSATQAGVRLVPQSFGLAIGSLGVGVLMRWTGKYYWLSVVVLLIYLGALTLISTFDLHTPNWEPFAVFFFAGLGYAGMLTITLLALIGAVAHEHQAVVTSASYAFRSTGSAIGITIVSAVFQNVLKGELWRRLGDWEGAKEIIPRVRDSLEEIKTLPEDWRVAVTDVYMDALRAVFVTSLGLAVLGFVCSLGMREHTLHSNLARK